MDIRISVLEVFRLEGRIVLAGEIDPPNLKTLPSGKCLLKIEGEEPKLFESEGEWITESRRLNGFRALSSVEKILIPDDWRQRNIEVTQEVGEQ